MNVPVQDERITEDGQPRTTSTGEPRFTEGAFPAEMHGTGTAAFLPEARRTQRAFLHATAAGAPLFSGQIAIPAVLQATGVGRGALEAKRASQAGLDWTGTTAATASFVVQGRGDFILSAKGEGAFEARRTIAPAAFEVSGVGAAALAIVGRFPSQLHASVVSAFVPAAHRRTLGAFEFSAGGSDGLFSAWRKTYGALALAAESDGVLVPSLTIPHQLDWAASSDGELDTRRATPASLAFVSTGSRSLFAGYHRRAGIDAHARGVAVFDARVTRPSRVAVAGATVISLEATMQRFAELSLTAAGAGQLDAEVSRSGRFDFGLSRAPRVVEDGDVRLTEDGRPRETGSSGSSAVELQCERVPWGGPRSVYRDGNGLRALSFRVRSPAGIVAPKSGYVRTSAGWRRIV